MLILNDTLAEYFDKDGPRAEEQSVLTTGNYEKMRLRSRVRAFAWAPSIGATDNFGIIGTQLNWDPHIVALSTDDNQIVFVLIKSPATTFGHDDDWSAKVLAHVSLVPAADQTFSEMPTSIEDIFQQQRFISHIAWSPWTVFNGEYRSVLAYATNEDVRARVITYIDDGVEFGPEVVFATIDLRNNGAMKWSPRVFDDGKVFLVMFSHSGITCLTVSAIDASIISESSKNPDNRLDENSGIVWDHPASAPAHLHFSTYTNTARSLVSAMRVSEDGALVVLPPPNWREQINDSKALFSMQHELQGNVTSKVSGLCASPLRDFIATCYTLHPSDMLEYGPPANRRCTITIHGLRSFSRPSINFPHGHASAESVLFTIKKWLDNTIEDADQIPEFTDTVLKKLLEVYAPEHAVSPAPGGTTPSYNPQDLGQCVREFKRKSAKSSVPKQHLTNLRPARPRLPKPQIRRRPLHHPPHHSNFPHRPPTPSSHPPPHPHRLPPRHSHLSPPRLHHARHPVQHRDPGLPPTSHRPHRVPHDISFYRPTRRIRPPRSSSVERYLRLLRCAHSVYRPEYRDVHEWTSVSAVWAEFSCGASAKVFEEVCGLWDGVFG